MANSVEGEKNELLKRKDNRLLSGNTLAYLTIFISIFFVGWFVWKLLLTEDNYRVQRRAMIAHVDGKSYLVSIVGHFRAHVVKKQGGSTIRKGSTEYYLTVNQLPLGELVAKKKLGSGKEKLSSSSLRLLSILNADLYVLAGKPMRISLPNLQEKPLTMGVDENLLPYEHWQYLTDKSNNIVWIELRDGNRAWLNPETGEIKSSTDANAPEPPSNRDARQIRAVMGLTKPRYTDLITPWHFSKDSSLYYFSNPEEPLKKIGLNALNRYQFEENENLRFYKTNFTRDQRMGSILIKDSDAKQMSNETFLQAGFLRNENTGEAMHPSNGFLVASRTTIGKDGLLQLTWLDDQTGGIKSKETVTRIDNLKQIIFDKEFIVVVGTEFGTNDAEPGRDRIYVAYTDNGGVQWFHIHFK